MSEPITSIEAGPACLNERGHVERDVAIAILREHLLRERSRAEVGLAMIEADEVKVFHQRGINVVRDRREVTS
jgi:hypothetical protein